MRGFVCALNDHENIGDKVIIHTGVAGATGHNSGAAHVAARDLDPKPSIPFLLLYRLRTLLELLREA